ncbi:hypothetical protein D1007_58300 [Hordeum vulgare]|nr:hypothetical protein D1007_58300 [Hordeum vulgare]
MNLLIPHLHYSAQYHIFSTLLLSQNRSNASDFRLPPDIRGPVDRPASKIRSRAPEERELYNSDFRLPPDVRGPDVRPLRKSGALHQKNVSSITRISSSLRTSEGRTSDPFGNSESCTRRS